MGDRREGTKGFPFLFCISPPFPLLFSVLFCPSFPDISSGQNGQKRGGGKEGDGWGTEGTDIVIEALSLAEKVEKKPWGKEERMEVLTFYLRAALEKCEGQVERMRSREKRLLRKHGRRQKEANNEVVPERKRRTKSSFLYS